MKKVLLRALEKKLIIVLLLILVIFLVYIFTISTIYTSQTSAARFGEACVFLREKMNCAHGNFVFSGGNFNDICSEMGYTLEACAVRCGC